ncbi:hypothetical protein [Bradyrhizobium quebecense]|uniref:STAS domain-containing protein n=2 Tax=Bradyrhizobium quebecense TaxID=2748629 RepID=A0ABS3M8Y6_9BRAD|nr:hypothetical protein [Bradyrhizobium quebecense]UGY03279.1 hypothetical protein J4P68_0000405 [Bradyrhizobium quebecense]
MTKLIISLDLAAAMRRHDIDRLGAIELVQQIIARHGGAVDLQKESAEALLDDLAEHGFTLLSGHSVQ